MAKKDLKKGLASISRGALGLMQPTTTATPVEKPQPSSTQARKKICVSLNTTNLEKLKTIGAENGFPLNSLIDQAISRAIEQYEKAHGEIKLKTTTTTIETIF